MHFFSLIRAISFATVLFALAPIATAQTAQHPWVVAPPKPDPQAYFTNLQSGARVQSPFVAKFGMSHWGIAPAGQPLTLTGHHHLLINQALPLDIQAPLPFSERYVHFGKGQMEAILTLPPGRHTLRLLLADDKHRPHFVFSPSLAIEVLPGVSPLDASYGQVPALELIGLTEGQVLTRPFRLLFHASGLNVAPRSTKLAGTGFFRVRFTARPGGAVTDIAFPNGQTEAWFSPPRGNYVVQLLFETNPGGALSPASAGPITIAVGG